MGNRQTQRILADLIELTDQIDSGEMANFNIRKSFVYYDVSLYVPL